MNAARRHGVLTGLAIGLVEAALVLSGATNTFLRWYEWMLMPFAGVVIYVLGGLAGGVLLGRWLGEHRAPWWLLFVAGSAWLVKCRFMTVQPARIALAIGGGLAAAVLLAWMLRRKTAPSVDIVARFVAVAANSVLLGGTLRAAASIGGVTGVALDCAALIAALGGAVLASPRVATMTPRDSNRRLLLFLVAIASLAPASALHRQVAQPPLDRAPNAATPARPRALAPADAPDVVLVTWDTVRTDSLPCFGGGGLDTPALDRLVREGALFTDCRAVAPSTAPAHVSLLTGLMPPRHGLRSNGDTAPVIATPRLPELLDAAGYRTGGFVSTYVLRKVYGFDRGFQHYDDRGAHTPLGNYISRFDFGSMLVRKFVPAKLRETGTHTPGRVTLQRAQEWLAPTNAPTAAPRFLWTHYYDAHLPFTPESPFRERTLARATEGPRAADPAQQDALIAQRAEIELLDALLGELLATLERGDPGLRRTWIVLVADHGECFGEGGHIGHHRVLYDATQHVALAIRPPTGTPGLPTGVRVDVPCNQVDVAPTLCDALGGALDGAPHAIDGTSLLPAWRGEEFPERGFYMEAYQSELGDQRLQGWSERGHDLVRALDGKVELFAPEAPLPVDVSDAQPDIRDRLQQRLDAWLEAHPAIEGGARALSDEEQSALRALGYANGG
ncbi:MAG: hypothetical protein EXS13_07660 [Planctomycetes bacterium]|nr:hypothetical protein [Planctomycetota bacterium]